MALLSPCLCHLHGDDLLSPQMTPAEVTVPCAAASQAGLPGATAEPSLPCEAPELLGTAHALPTAALRSRSTTRSGDKRQQGHVGAPRRQAEERGTLESFG